MISRYSRKVSLLILGAVLVCLIAIAPAGAYNLINDKYMANVRPGTTVTYSLALAAGANESPADYQATVLGFGETLNGFYTGIEPAQDTGPYTARPFITLDNSTVHLVPGGEAVITATIKVPSSGKGGLYALIDIEPVSSSNILQSTSVNIGFDAPVMITLDGTTLTETGVIENVTVGTAAVGQPVSGTAVTGQPISVSTFFTNTGNHHYYSANNQIKIMDNSGKVIGNGTTDYFTSAIVPGATVAFTQQITTPLNAGTYSVTSSVMNSAGQVLDTKTSSFTVYEAPTASPTEYGAQGSNHGSSYLGPSSSTNVPASQTTQSPVGLPVIVMACAIAVGILGMRRKPE